MKIQIELDTENFQHPEVVEFQRALEQHRWKLQHYAIYRNEDSVVDILRIQLASPDGHIANAHIPE